ncbi:MAG: hypothetical protein GWN93_05755 [Deltaproteobacteria bacterium]|nr:hypothetical protein [Deltaproteobacteria bacterium]
MKRAALIVVLVLLLSALAGATAAFALEDTVTPAVPTLLDAIIWVLNGGGAGALTYLAIDKIKWLSNLGPDNKRYASYVLILLLSAVAWGFGMLMGYMPVPGHWREWVEVAFTTLFTGLFTSLTIHAKIDLRKKRLEAGQ